SGTCQIDASVSLVGSNAFLWRSPRVKERFTTEMVGKVLTIGPRSSRNSSRCGRTDNPRRLSLQQMWVEWGIMTHTWIDIGKPLLGTLLPMVRPMGHWLMGSSESKI
ncbi:unnamed protein product, partial [Linum tenue]